MTERAAGHDAEDDTGGDAVCWLNRLCPECGAMPSGGATTCWRCGAEVPDAPADDRTAGAP